MCIRDSCKAANGCSKKDLEKFMAKLEDADAVIVATPVYNCLLYTSRCV